LGCFGFYPLSVSNSSLVITLSKNHGKLFWRITISRKADFLSARRLT